eukprot:CAMPEP_0114224718 /NCGR_PEP_ID=MMETSP0058-20121206/261_1 /TAXON_ID=36894 /ORGANISM="Pyramimonas parkeae, CCMP726" /LENGTH=124 /DNA_ID=CAMNT_0001335221 /DNA_START=58 /DNA_END=432 /DNA_ORIENTATION=+
MAAFLAPAPTRLNANASTSARLPSRSSSLRVVAMAEKRSRSSVAEVAQFQRSPADCGSTEVQIALLSSRVINLTAHLKANKKDYDSQRGLLKVLGQRKRLLGYLRKSDPAKFESMVADLKIRIK